MGFGLILIILLILFFLILSILFANFVSKDIFGIYKYIISITAIAGVFSLTGMNVAVMRAVAQGFDGIFKKSLIEQFKWSWPQFFFLLSFGAYYLYQNNLTYGLAFLIISIFAPLSGIANTYNAVLYGKKDFRISAFLWFLVRYFILFANVCSYIENAFFSYCFDHGILYTAGNCKYILLYSYLS